MVKFLEKLPFYPFIIAVYPIVYLLAENIDEINPGAGLRSALIFLVIALIAFLFAWLLTRNLKKSGIIAAEVQLIFFLSFFVLYAPLYRWLRDVQLFGQVLGRHRYLVPLTVVALVVAAVVTYLLLRSVKEKPLKSITFALNMVSLFLILIPVITMLSYTAKKQFTTRMSAAELPPLAQATTVPENPPDIYLIILDMHVSDTALRNLTGYEDPVFSDSLREKGFYVAECSRSNYPSTQYSLASQLNLDYVQNLTDSTDLNALYQLMQSNRVLRTVEEAGYRTYAFETGYSFTELKGADEFLKPLSSAADLLTYPGVTPFESLILKVSGGQILYETRDQLSEKMQYIIDAPYVEYRDRILFDLETLPELAEETEPKFVFAHILAPHSPFVFDRDGNFIKRRTPFALDSDPEGYDFYEFSDAYYEELIYIHARVLEVVDAILEKSATSPIIIIQGDHGIPRTASRNAQYEIYNAIYMGGNTSDDLYSTISPVNSFRLIFDQVFGTSYQLLPDETYSFDADQGEYSPFTGSFTCP